MARTRLDKAGHDGARSRRPADRTTRPMRTPFAAIERPGAPSVGVASGAIFLN
jgi:hypothetical protein